MPNLLTFNQYRRSVADFLVRVKKDNITEQRAVATTGSSSFAYIQYAKDRFALSLDWVAQANAAGNAITDLEVKSEYLGQLKEMRGLLSPQEKQDERLSVQLDLAQKSADLSPLRITLEDLRKATTASLESMLSRGTLQHLFTNHGLMQFGMQNAAAIRLQCPDASRLFTRRQLVSANVPQPKGVQPLIIYAPTLKSFFEREGSWLPISAASYAEQRSIAMGDTPLRQDIQFAANQVYDISQLPNEYQRNLLAEEKNVVYSYDSLREFADTIKSENGFAIKTEFMEMHGLAVSSVYNAQKNTILLNQNQEPDRLTKSYLNSLSEATVALTSNQSAAVQEFEATMLSLQLQSYGGIRPSAADFARVSETFLAANSFMDASHKLPGTMSALESSFARVNKMSSFIHHHVTGIIQRTEEQAQTLSQANTQFRQKGQEQKVSGTEQLTNFLNEIH